MTPHYADDWLTVYHGDARAVMAEMPAESVHCVVTSPPYWGLRDYGTASWLGGEDECDHIGPPKASDTSGLNHGRGRSTYEDEATVPYLRTCGKCGATRIDSQLGLEPTPEAYVANMVAVFREVRRVLRSDGTVWLNLGDSYAGSWGANGRGEGTNAPRADLEAKHGTNMPNRNPPGIKPKDLVGIPWRVAFALQADGWYLRSDIIWSKPNPMPESVTDRPTKSHEYLFLLSKSPRYYFDHVAIREPMKEVSLKRLSQPNVFDQPGGPKDSQTGNRSERKAINNQAERLVKHEKWKTRFEGWDEYDKDLGRNIRSVWTIATAPYPGAHFATFPPKLVEPCIKAGTSERGVCPECGRHWRRVTETTKYEPEIVAVGVRNVDASRGDKVRKLSGADYNEQVQRRTLSWIPPCAHGHDPVPATVLDPFAGSGTTGMVAQSLSRRAILIDLSMDYLGQLMERNRDIPLGM